MERMDASVRWPRANRAGLAPRRAAAASGGQFAQRGVPCGSRVRSGHLRMAWHYVGTMGGEARALPQIRTGIQRYNAANRHRLRAPYNETITRAFVRLVATAMEAAARAGTDPQDFDAFLAANAHLASPAILLTYYSPERLYSEAARTSFIEPDRKPLP